MDFELKKRRKGRVNIWYANTGSRAGGGGEAGLIAGSYLDVVSGSFADNSFIIRDTVTPANNYSGELITNGRFNKFTYSRAGLATMTGSDGLIQWAPHNLYTYSAQSDDALWVKTAVTVAANSIASPDGTTTADSMLETTANDTHVIQNQITFDVATTYTVSRFAKTLGGRDFYFQVNNNSGAGGAAVAFFDLTNGVAKVGTDLVGGITNKSVAIQSMGNGWYRCSFTFTTPAADANIVYHGSTSSYAAETRSFVGDTAKGVYLWGAQANVGILQTYYPTTAAAFHGPRIHYNPSTLAILGYQHEGARANLCLQSEAFDNASWSAQDITVTANNTTAPDGSGTADKCLENGALGRHGFFQSVTIASGPATATLFAKNAAGARFLRLSLPVGSTDFVYATFDLVNGTMTEGPLTPGGSSITALSASIQALPNGWYRLSVGGSGAFAYCGMPSIQQTGTPIAGTDFGFVSFTGDSTSGFYLWGSQIEVGGAASSYKPTTTIAVTQAADVAPFMTSSQFNLTQAAATFYVKNTWDGGTAVGVNARVAASVYHTSGDNRAMIYNGGATIALYFTDNGVQQAYEVDLAVADGVFNKAAAAYALNDFALVQNGRTPQTHNSGTIPAMIRFEIGGQLGNPLFGTIQEFAFIGERVSNGAMQALTT